MSAIGFKRLEGILKKKGNVSNPGAVAASVMHKKYKESDIKKHQKSGTSMKNVTPKKHFGMT